jgi:hypothetical protein
MSKEELTNKHGMGGRKKIIMRVSCVAACYVAPHGFGLPSQSSQVEHKVHHQMGIRCSIYTFEFDYFCRITRGEYEKTSAKSSMLLAGQPDA